VQFCELSVSARPSPTQRLVIPIYTLESPAVTRLAGWQARYVGNCPDSVPKYLSCKGMKKSQLLYGLPEAVGFQDAVVVVEGPTDVWRLGAGAVAIFGKDMSLHQQELLDRFLPNRPVVVFLDRDAQDKAVELQRTLLNRGRVAVLAGLPDGRDDVGDCTSEEAWRQVGLALERLR
jgi:DNA primase